MFSVLTTQVPLVGSQANGQDATSKSGGGFEVDNTCAAVVNDVVPSAQHGRVGGLLPRLYHVGVRSQTIGIEVPHAVVVALHASADEAIDASIEVRMVGHTTIDVVTRVVVDLSIDIADDGMHAPGVRIVAAFSVAIDARCISLGNTSQAYGELCGMVGEQQVTTIVAESLQRIDNLGRRQAGQILPTFLKSHAVAHDPASGIFLNVQFVNGGRGNQCAILLLNIVLLEPCYGILLVSRACGIVVRNEHGQQTALARLIGDKETNGLSLRHGTIGKAGLDGVAHVNICRSLLDEIAGGGTFQLNDVIIVLDNLNAHNVTCRIRPAQGYLAATLRNVGSQFADGIL